MLQETKVSRKGKIFNKIKGYEVFELLRENKDAGGLATAIKEEFKACLIYSGDDEVELMTVEVKVNNFSITRKSKWRY